MRGSRAVMVAGGCAVIVGAGWAASPKELPSLDLVEPGATASGGATSSAEPSASAVPVTTPEPTLSCGPDDSGDDDDDDKDRTEDDDCVLVTPDPSPTATDTAPAATASEAPAGASSTFDGPVVTNARGGYQARITVVDGVVTDVQAVVAGTDDAQSVQVNAMAIPELRQKVLEAQTWDVEAVSGASFTSPAFIESLEGAFAEAGL